MFCCRRSNVMLLLILVLALTGCSKKDGSGAGLPIPADSVQTINRWILDSMLRYYYWSSDIKIPADLSGNPGSFFSNLKSPLDKYSWISDGKSVGPDQSSFSRFGFDYMIADYPPYSSSQLLGVITLVAPASIADFSSLVRGTCFNKVNNLPLNATNVSAIQSLFAQSSKITLSLVRDSAGIWVSAGSKQMSPQYFEDRPVYKRQVFEKAGVKTGYIFYNAFSENFDADLLAAFASLRSQAVQELIIDMRYNSGGSTSSAAKMMYLSSSCKPTDIFSIFQGNRNLYAQAPTFLKAVGNSTAVLSDLDSRRLNLSRVFILCSQQTASAAEMVINGLRPYMNVISIGSITAGKDMAGSVIRDLRQPKKIHWLIQPMIFKISNASNQGDYASGLSPDFLVEELKTLPLYGLGSKSDPLIKKSLELIYGSNEVNTMQATKEITMKPQEIRRLVYVSERPDVPVLLNR